MFREESFSSGLVDQTIYLGDASPEKAGVGGSTPSLGTISFKYIQRFGPCADALSRRRFVTIN